MLSGTEKRPDEYYYLRSVYKILSGFVLVPVPAYAQNIVCPKCGSQVSSVSNYCNFCGTKLHRQIVLKICPLCKNRIPELVKFCPECGANQ